MCAVSQSCLTLCDPMDRNPPGFSVHEIFQAWILEWVAISFSRGPSWSRDWTHVSLQLLYWQTSQREVEMSCSCCDGCKAFCFGYLSPCMSFNFSLPFCKESFSETIFGNLKPSGGVCIPIKIVSLGLPWWSSGWESLWQCRGHGFDSWSRKISHARVQLVHVPQLLSPCAATTEAWAPRPPAPQREEPPQWEVHGPQLESSPCSPQLEKAHTATKTQSSQT